MDGALRFVKRNVRLSTLLQRMTPRVIMTSGDKARSPGISTVERHVLLAREMERNGLAVLWQRWRARVGIVAAAFASIATSALEWSLSATFTSEVVPETKVYRYTITASAQPSVRVVDTRKSVA